MATYYPSPDKRVEFGSPEAQAQKDLQTKIGALTSNPSKRDIPANLIPDFYSGKISYEDVVSAIGGSPNYDPSLGPIINKGAGPEAPQTTLTPDETKSRIQSHVSATALGQTDQGPFGTRKSTSIIDSTKSGINAITSGAPSLPGSTDTPGSAPAVPDFNAIYADASSKLGLDEAQKTLNDIDTQIAKIMNDALAAQQGIQGETTSSRYQARAMSQISKENRQLLADLKTQRAQITQSINSRLRTVNSIMSSAKSSFTDAMQLYKDQETQWNTYQRAFQTEQNRETSNALKEINMYAGLMKEGNLSFDKISDDQKAHIAELEMQAGVPGYLESIAKESGKPVYHVKNSDGSVTGIFQNKSDGSYYSKKLAPATTTGSGGYTPAEIRQKKIDIGNQLRSNVGDDGKVSPDDYKKAYDDWSKLGGTTASFTSEFGYLRDPQNQYYFDL